MRARATASTSLFTPIPMMPPTSGPFASWCPPLVRRFAPDVLVTQLGVDTHFLDPLTQLALTTEGHAALFAEFDELATMPWLACGGGGYNLDVVPRSWTLAFGVMSGQTLPDDLPESYRETYGGQWLHDHEKPALDGASRSQVRRHAEQVVAAVQSAHASLEENRTATEATMAHGAQRSKTSPYLHVAGTT